MGVVVDANTIPAVFNRKNANHEDFEAVLFWIVNGKAKLIVGGTVYMKELAAMESYLRFVTELGRLRKVHRADDHQVDNRQSEIRKQESASDFDDSHIVALLSVTRCRVFCSCDARSFKYIQDPRFYRRKVDRPRIYTNVDHKPRRAILCDRNLCPNCAPHDQLSQAQIRSLSFM
jgi:predicted nucleic acid-binding protein